MVCMLVGWNFDERAFCPGLCFATLLKQPLIRCYDPDVPFSSASACPLVEEKYWREVGRSIPERVPGRIGSHLGSPHFRTCQGQMMKCFMNVADCTPLKQVLWRICSTDTCWSFWQSLGRCRSSSLWMEANVFVQRWVYMNQTIGQRP